MRKKPKPPTVRGCAYCGRPTTCTTGQNSGNSPFARMPHSPTPASWPPLCAEETTAYIAPLVIEVLAAQLADTELAETQPIDTTWPTTEHSAEPVEDSPT